MTGSHAGLLYIQFYRIKLHVKRTKGTGGIGTVLYIRNIVNEVMLSWEY